MTTISWINNSGGDWGVATNWSPGQVPGSGDDVQLPTLFSPYTVTVTSAQSAHSLILADGATLALSSTLNLGTLLDFDGGTLDLNAAGEIVGGTIAGAGVVFNDGTLSGVTVEGPLDLSAGNRELAVANGIVLTGTAGSGPGEVLLTGSLSYLLFQGTQTLDDASVSIGAASAYSVLEQRYGGSLTLGPDLLVSATGVHAEFAIVGATDTIVNQGTIVAAAAGGTFLISGGGSVVNQGIISVLSSELVNADTLLNAAGGSLVVDPGSLVNSGYISGAVTLAGGSYLNNYATGTIVAAGTAVLGTVSPNTVVNAGTISAGRFGVYLDAGGSVSNSSGGLIEGTTEGIEFSDSAGTVVNAGTIAGRFGVYLDAGGSVSNSSGGLIEGTTEGIVFLGSAGTVVNAGTIAGVYLFAGGSVSNSSGGLIEGTTEGIFNGSAGTVVNAGTIAGGIGVELFAGGSVSNSSGGLIDGYEGVEIGGGTITNSGAIVGATGVVVVGGGGTIVNYGTIASTYGAAGTAVNLGYAGDDALLTSGGDSLLVGVVTNVHAGDAFDLPLLSYSGGGYAALQAENELNVVENGVTAGIRLDPNQNLGNYLFTPTRDNVDGTEVVVTERSPPSPPPPPPSGYQIYGTNTGIVLDNPDVQNPATIVSGAYVTNDTRDYSSTAIQGESPTAWTIDNYGTVNGDFNDQGDGIYLEAGGTVTNAAGGTIAGYSAGVYTAYASYQPATVFNTGLIVAAGGHDTGVNLGHGGYVYNSAGGVISGSADGVAMGQYGTVINYGTISGYVGVTFIDGGVLANAYGGLIEGYTAGVIDAGGGTVSNSGMIGAYGAGGIGVVMTNEDAGVTNASTGYISGGEDGVDIFIGPSTLANYGTILGGTGDGVYLSATGVVSNASGALISGGYNGVALYAAGTVVDAGVIAGASSDVPGDGVYLASAGLVAVSSGGTIVGYQDGVYASYESCIAATVVNQGTIAAIQANGDGIDLGYGGYVDNQSGGLIAGVGAGVFLDTGGQVTNAGTIAAQDGYGVELFGGGSADNSGLISALWGGVYISGAPGTVGNSGTIDATYGNGVLLPGGYVDNSGTIEAGGYGIFGASTVVNSGTIIAVGAGHLGVAMAGGGYLTNQSSGYIYGGALVNGGGARTIINYGTIVRPNGVGAFMQDGYIDNRSGGAIAGATGVSVNYGTLVDAGTIGGASGTAVYFAGSGNLLALSPGYALGGAVIGGGDATNALELASGGAAGALSGLGTNLQNFATVTVDPGAYWTLSGYNIVGPGVTLTDNGTLSDNGILVNAGSLYATGYLLVDPATLVNSGYISATVTLAGGSYLDNTATGTITDTGTAVFGTMIANTVVNYGTISAGGVGVDLAYGGSVTNGTSAAPSGLIYGTQFGIEIGNGSGTGTVVNYGTIGGGGGDAVILVDSGNVTNAPGGLVWGGVAVALLGTGVLSNAGTIAGSLIGVDIEAAVTLNNNSGGQIEGYTGVQVLISAGAVDNAGTIAGMSGTGIYFANGGSITNAQSGLIGGDGGVVIARADGTVTNSSTIVGTSGNGVSMSGGVLTNSAGGLVVGALYGAEIGPQAATVFNAGTIASSDPDGSGLRLAGGGSIDNTGLIAGSDHGLFLDIAADVTNRGSIIGAGGVDAEGGGSLDNFGLILGTAGAAIAMAAGGTVTNYGSVVAGGSGTDAIDLGDASLFDNRAGGLVSGAHYGAALGGTVANAGTILGGDDAVIMRAAIELVVNSGVISSTYATVGGAVYLVGGTLTNAQTGLVAGYSFGVAIGQTSGTIDNLGTIVGTGNGAAAVDLDGGRLVNSGGGMLVGGQDGADLGAPGTVVNAGTISGSSGYGLRLFQGGYIDNTGSIVGGDVGIYSDAAATVTNDGLIAGYTGIENNGPGLIVNSGTIAGSDRNGIYSFGGSVTNAATGLVTGYGVGVGIGYAGGAILNLGTIESTWSSGAGVALNAGGTLTNRGAIIAAGTAFPTGAYVASGGLVDNFGTVTAPDSSDGVAINLARGGTLVNEAAGYLQASSVAVVIQGGGAGSGSIANYGTITGSGDGIDVKATGDAVFNSGVISGAGLAGVYLYAGGNVTNSTTGLIQGYDGVLGSHSAATAINLGTIVGTGDNGVGVEFFAPGSTLTNAGTIAADTDAAVQFYNTGDRLIVAPGAVFFGIVNGGAALGNTLELATGAGAGTLTGLGTSFENFGTVPVDGGAQWTFAGANSIGEGVTLTDQGTLINAGALDAAGNLIVDPGTMINSGYVSGTVTLAGASYLDNTATGMIVAGGTAVLGTTSPNTVANSGTISAGQVGVDLLAGGTVVNAVTTALIRGGQTGIYISGAAGTVSNYGTILGSTSNGTGIDLDDGGRISDASNATVSGGRYGIFLDNGGTVVASGVIAGGGALGDGIFDEYGALDLSVASGGLITGETGVHVQYTNGTIVNSGGIIGSADYGVLVRLGIGTVVNYGTVAGATGVLMRSAGVVVDQLGGLISGSAGAVAIDGYGNVANSGRIAGGTSYGDTAVSLGSGGSVSNASGAVISAYDGIHIAGAAGVVTNSGVVQGSTGEGGNKIGVELLAGGSVSNAATGVIEANYAVFIYGALGTVTNAGLIEGDNDVVELDRGGTVENTGTISATGTDAVYLEDIGTVSNGGLIAGSVELLNGGLVDNGTGGLISATSGTGLAVVLDAGGTVVNAGTIIAAGTAVVATTGPGTVVNSGTVTATGNAAIGILLEVGGTITNAASAFVAGYQAGVYIKGSAGALANFGTIAMTGASGLGGARLEAGGTIANFGTIAGGAALERYAGSAADLITNGGGVAATALITGPADGIDAYFSAPTTVVNAATIVGVTGDGINLFAGGDIINSAGLIAGEDGGAKISNSAGTVTNQATITGSGFGPGIALYDGGFVTNAAGGLVSGGEVGVLLQSAATVANYGTIVGATGTAISFGSAAGDELVVGSGSVLSGAVANISAGDVIDFAAFAFSAGNTASYSDGILTVSGGGQTTSLTLADVASGSVFNVTSDGHGGTDVSIQATNNSMSFSDDFTPAASSEWNNFAGEWTASDGSYYAQVPNNDPAAVTLLPFDLSDLTLTVTVNNLGDGGILFDNDYATSPAFSGSATDGVALVLGGEGYGQGARDEDAGNSIYWADTDGSEINAVNGVFTPGDSYTITVTVQGDVYSAYVNGAATPVTTLTYAGAPSGDIGLYDDQPNTTTGDGSGPTTTFSDFSVEGTSEGLLQGGTVTGGIELSAAVQNPATIVAGAYVTNDTANFSGDAVYGTSAAAWTLTNSGTINATQPGSDGVFFAAGGTVINAASGLIKGDDGIHVAQDAGTVVNDGVVIGSGAQGVHLENGGLVANGGAIFGGGGVAAVEIDSYGSAAGSVTNTGTIAASGSGFGVLFGTGVSGYIGNSGLIEGSQVGILISNQPATIDNSGTIVTTATIGGAAINLHGGGTIINDGAIENLNTVNAPAGTGGIAIGLESGLLVNAAGATINGGIDTALVAGYGGRGAPGGFVTVSNFGTIENASTRYTALYFGAGGAVTNAAGALIASSDGGVAFADSLGTAVSVGTVVNSGTIASMATGTSGVAVYFAFGGTLTNVGLISGAHPGTPVSGTTGGYPGVVLAETMSATVVNLGTIINPNNGNGVDLLHGGLVVNGTAGVTTAMITAPHTGLYIGGRDNTPYPGAFGTVVNYGTIAGTDLATAGSAVAFAWGGTVVNRGLIDSANDDGVSFKAQGTAAGTIENFGTIAAGGSGTSGEAIYLGAGGLVTNDGLISGARAGTSAANGYPGAVEAHNTPATLVNLGTIANPNDSNGVNLLWGGLLLNGSAGAASALITAPHGGIYMGGKLGTAYVGAVGTVVNYGTIAATDASSTAPDVELASGGTIENFGLIRSLATAHSAIYSEAGGLVTNAAGATVAASDIGIHFGDTSGTTVSIGTVVNQGTIESTGATAGEGVLLAQGGTLSNASGALIDGYVGITVSAGGSTIVNAGTIAGAGGTALSLTGSGNRIVVDPGAVFSGYISGGGAGASDDIVELAAGLGSGTILNNGLDLHDFGGAGDELLVDPGAVWVISASGTVPLASAVDFGTVIFANTITNNVTMDIETGATLELTSGVAGSGSIDFAGDGGLLLVGGTTMPTNTLGGFAPGDTIDLRNIAGGGAGSATLGAGNLLTVSEGGQSYQLQFDPAQSFGSAMFSLTADGSGGTDLAVFSGVLVGSGQTLVISAGENLSGIVVQSGGVLDVLAGATVSDAIIEGDATETVDSGGLDIDATVEDGGVQQVYGTASGVLLVAGGSQTVEAGGSAVGTVEDDDALQTVSSGGFASGTVVSAGDQQVVLSGGAAVATTVDIGGSEIVSAGGTTSRATISGGGVIELQGGAVFTVVLSGGVLGVSAGGAADATTIDAGGSETIGSGGIDTDATVESGGVQTVYGAASAAVVAGGGSQTVAAGGTTSGTFLDGVAVQTVSSGGVAIATAAGSGDQQIVLAGGTAIATKVLGGSEIVAAGGTLSAAYVGSGLVSLAAGAAASGTITFGASGGELQIDALTALFSAPLAGLVQGDTLDLTALPFTSAVSAGLNASGALAVTSGGISIEQFALVGTAAGTQFAVADDGSGFTEVSVSPPPFPTLVSSGQTVTVSAGQTVSNIVIEAGGTLDVASGGVITGATIDAGGTENVEFGALDLSATVESGGAQNVYGSASGTRVIAGGSQTVEPGGSADGTVLDSAALQIVSSGGIAIATTVSAGDEQIVLSGGVAIATTVSSGGSEIVAAGGAASGVTIAGGLVDLQSGGLLSGAVSFVGPAGTLESDAAAVSSTVPIDGFSAGDTINLPNVVATGIDYQSGTITLSDAGSVVATLAISTPYSNPEFSEVRDSTGGSEINVSPPAAGDFTYITDFAKTNVIQTGLIKEFPTGIVTGDEGQTVPFDIAPDASGDNFSEIASSLTIDVSIPDVTNIFTLLNAYDPPPDLEAVSVEFIGSEGATQTFTLADSSNLRDFYQGDYANTINGTTTQNFFTIQNVQDAAGTGNVTTGDFGTYNIDEQDFALDSAFATQTLTQIVITNLAPSEEVPILLGVTAEAAPPVSQLFYFEYTYNSGGDYYEGSVADDGQFGYHVGETIATGNGEYTILADAGTTAEASGQVYVSDYSHDEPGVASPVPLATAAETADGSDGLGSEHDAVLGTDGNDYSFSDASPVDIPTNGLFGFTFDYDDGSAFYTGTVAVASGSEPAVPTSPIGTYSVFAEGLTAAPVGTVVVDRFTLDGVSFMPINGGSTTGLGSETGTITVNGQTYGFTDQNEPNATIAAPVVSAAPPTSNIYQAEVDGIYADVLALNPSDPSEADEDPSDWNMAPTYVSMLGSGTTTVAAIEQTLANGQYAQNLLTEQYQQVTGGGISASDLSTYTADLAAGSSQSAIRLLMAESASATTAVANVYEQVFDSQPTAGELDDAISYLGTSGTLLLLQQQLAAGAVMGSFATILGREPDAAELAGIQDQLANGISETTLSDNLSSSGSAGGYTLVPVGSGDATLTAPPDAPTQFDFANSVSGAVMIAGFDPTIDAIQVSDSQVSTYRALLNDETAANGGTLITFADGLSITLSGITQAQLTAANFYIDPPAAAWPQLPDVLWTDPATGDTGYWTIDALGAAAGFNNQGNAAAGYTAVAAGNLSGSGQPEVLWENQTTGDTGYWATDASGQATGFVDLGQADTSYAVAGVGDFDGSGHDEVLWQDAATGDTGYWATSSSGQVGGFVDLGQANTSYGVVGVGDFDGAGRAEVLWEDKATGDTGYWATNSGGLVTGFVDLGQASSAYSVVGVGDFSGLGFDEVLWEDAATGDIGYWTTNGQGQVTGFHDFGFADTAYSVIGTGDYDNSGHSEVLWEDAATGDVGYWTTSPGGAVTGFHDLGAANTSYHLVPP